MPYKCCYAESIKDGSKTIGCHEISKKTYDRLDDYIQEKKTEVHLESLIFDCGEQSETEETTEKENAANVTSKHLIVLMLSFIFLFL